MKKLFALLAVVLAVVSCQRDADDLNVAMGGEQEVMLTVSLPEATRANSAQGFDISSLANTDYSLRYILEVYRVTESGVLYDTCQRFVETSDGTSMVFPVRLAPGYDYRIVAWADIIEQNAVDPKADRCYKTTDGLDAVEIIDGMWKPMDETRDAYTGLLRISDFGNGNTSTNYNITLQRPFAKIRVVATDIADIRKVGLEPTKAEMSYSENMYLKFNAVADTENNETDRSYAAERKNVEYTYVQEYYEAYSKDAAEFTLFTDYIFVPESRTAKFTLNVYADANKSMLIKGNNFNTDIFVERNKLTTIKGDVLTTGGNIKVTVDNDLGVKETYTYVDTAEDLQDKINNAATNGEETNISLGGNIDLSDLLNAGTLSTRAAQTAGLVIPAGKSVVLDLNGYTIRQEKECSASYSMIENKGNLTILDSSENKTGKISFKDTSAGDPNFGWGSYTLRNEGTLLVKSGTIEHLGEQDAHMICALFQYSGSTTIDGGKISTPYYRSARLWHGDMTINGGDFEGQLWLQAVADDANLTINGGTFAPRGGDFSSVFVSNIDTSGVKHNVAVSVTGGHFTTKIGMSEPFACITGGTFTTVAKEATSEDLLANGYVFVEGENGTYTVENVGHYTDAEGNYYITNAKGLAWVSENVNTMEFYVSGSANIFDNKTVYLANDIDLCGAEWRPIGDYAFSRTSFNGVFDGQGYTVSNFKVTERVRWTEEVTNASYGFFGNVKGTIKNLTIKNATVNPEGGRYSAALVGRLHDGGCIENCHVENSSITILHWQVSGLVGQNNNGNISNCSVVGSTITGKAAVGAIVGMDMKAGEHTIKNCRVANTALVQNESFGASYDASYGLAVGLVNASGIVLNIDNVVAEKNTIKGVADNTLVGDIKTGATVTINGVSIATTAEQLAEALANGKNVVLTQDVTSEAATTTPYGNKYAFKQDGGVIDGNGHELYMECYGDDYGIMTSGGTIKNLTITEGCRAVMIMSPQQDVVLDNVKIGGDGVLYPINTGEGGAEGVNLIVTNSTLAGWTSYSLIESATFTNVEFKQGTYYNNIYGRVLKPYVNTVLTNCSFVAHMNLDLSSLTNGHKIVMKNCTVDGQAVTAEVFTIPSTDAQYDTEV
ncbi:MAG: hypothetical protein IIV52_02035, partial [Alistipes sp.]|nr:hypothetical protein [Alistipes sp.]